MPLGIYRKVAISLFSVIVLTLVVFYAVFRVNPLALGRYLIAQIGSGVGITVSVPQNPFNTLAQELREKESALLEKEEEIKQRELEFQERIAKEQRSRNTAFLVYLLTGGIVLLALILLDRRLDHRRLRK